MLSVYKKIEHNITTDLIKREYVTYENLINIFEFNESESPHETSHSGMYNGNVGFSFIKYYYICKN